MLEAIKAVLRGGNTVKLNFHPTKIHVKKYPLVKNSWFTKTKTLSQYKFSIKFQYIYSLHHVAPVNLFLLSLLATRYLMRR